jgi:hypothetical protein
VDTPSGEVAEKSSSYDLSFFSFGLIPKVLRLLRVNVVILVQASGSYGLI